MHIGGAVRCIGAPAPGAQLTLSSEDAKICLGVACDASPCWLSSLTHVTRGQVDRCVNQQQQIMAMPRTSAEVAARAADLDALILEWQSTPDAARRVAAAHAIIMWVFFCRAGEMEPAGVAAVEPIVAMLRSPDVGEGAPSSEMVARTLARMAFNSASRRQQLPALFTCTKRA